MHPSNNRHLPLLLYSILMLTMVGACSPVRADNVAVTTEQALVASLTAIADTESTSPIVVETPEPSIGSRADGVTFHSFEVENNFPDSITFFLAASSEAPIRRAAFFYWLEGQDSRNLERVAFTSGDMITASYTWETNRITVLPSTPIYFLWELEDEAGKVYVSDEMLVYFDDLRFAWNEISDDEIVVRWYEGSQDFGQLIYSTARESLDQMKAATGAGLDIPIFVLLYSNPEDFASWHFRVEEWVGGRASPPLGITTQIINPLHGEDWIRDVIPHEIAHLFFYQQIQSNLASWPSWMDEGFAQFFEFNDKRAVLARVERVAQEGALIPLRHLNGSFGPETEGVYQSYDQSLSVIVFLIETWGEIGLEALIREIREGQTINESLRAAFGVTFEEFEAGWITWLGTPATPAPSPTPFATFSVLFGAATETQTPFP